MDKSNLEVFILWPKLCASRKSFRAFPRGACRNDTIVQEHIAVHSLQAMAAALLLHYDVVAEQLKKIPDENPAVSPGGTVARACGEKNSR